MHSSHFSVHAGNAAHILYPQIQNGMQFYDPAVAGGWNMRQPQIQNGMQFYDPAVAGGWNTRQPYYTLQPPNSRFESV